MKIIFLDGCGGDYTGLSLSQQAKIGGTEVTIIHVAELLASEHEVYVLQKTCSKACIVNNVHYAPLSDLDKLQPDALIGVRPRRMIVKVAKLFPSIPCYYWMHDIPSKRLWKYKYKFQKSHCQIISISNYQVEVINNAWRGNLWQCFLEKLFHIKTVPINVIYNPVTDKLQPNDETKIDNNKLIFFSAPDRGLDMILDNFFKVLEKDDSFKLYIAHPGYASLDKYHDRLDHPNIKILGSLPNFEVIKHIRESLCVFYPQNIKPECFGMVYAESNALGTPVLAHDFGAAKEVLSNSGQLVDATNSDKVVNRLLSWKQERPKVCLDAKLRSKAALKAWNQLLNVS